MFYKYVIMLFLFYLPLVFAETCPTSEQIRDRKISKLFAWTVEEDVSLDELLSVQQLYAVRIINFDEYISCRYTTRQWPVRLDGKPEIEKCRISPEAGVWNSTDSGALVCQEKDVAKCGFKLECDD
jgi:hypothetical protein